MFNPIPVTTAWEDTTRTFFLQALNRTIEDDEVNLSLTIWSGFAGVGDAIPSDPWDGGDTEIDGTDNKNSYWPSMVGYYDRGHGVWLQSAARHIWSVSQPGQGLIGNQWSFACWVRINHRNFSEQLSDTPLDEEDRNAIANTNHVWRLYHRKPMRGDDKSYGKIEIGMHSAFNPPNPQKKHHVTVRVTDSTTTSMASSTYITGLWGDATTGQSVVQPWRNDLNSRNNGWIFIVVCFEGGPAYDEEEDEPTPKLRVYMNIMPHDNLIPGQPAGFHNRGMACLRQLAGPPNYGGLALTDFSYNKAIYCNSDNKNLHCIGSDTSLISRYSQPYGSGLTGAGQNTYHNRAAIWNVCIDSDSPPGRGGNSHYRMDVPPAGPYGRVDSLVNGFPYPGEGQPPEPKYDWSWTYKFGDENGEEIYPEHWENTTLSYINSLYNGGHGNEVNWRAGTFAENMVHYWMFGQVEEEFAIGSEVVRDIGNYRYGEDLNFCSQEPAILNSGGGVPRIYENMYPRATWVWRRHNALYQSNYPDDTYDPVTRFAIGPGGGPDGNSWSENTSINDIVSPDGANGTTQSDWTYPGKHL
jgi:hypothetical protein